MLALKLCQQFCPDKINFVLSNRLGDGADGEVFNLADYPNKVIKFAILYNYPHAPLDEYYNRINNTLTYIRQHQPQSYAHVYEHVYLGQYARQLDQPNIVQDYILYYYTMEKLFKISEDEKKVFHTIVCHEDMGIEKNYSLSQIKKILRDMGRALDFDTERVIFFYENLKKTPIVHGDVHVRNIMKDQEGNFKLIDFDRSHLLNKQVMS